MAARVYNIPPSAPFLPTLIGAMTEGGLGLPALRDPLALASATLYLPTRRACRLARDAFLDILKNEAAILPRIVPIGDIDEDEIAFAEAASGGIAEDALALPQALDPLERRLLLTQLVVKWANSPELHGQSGVPLVAQTPAAACALADDLARLIDDMTTRGVSWDKLNTLVNKDYDQYWQLTLRFLEIASKAWPDYLSKNGLIEAATRRDLLIKAEAARLARKTDGPAIAAGSTGSIPATAELIATIARLPHGAVVLPGLDTDLDEAAWRLIGGETKDTPPAPGHPQFAMRALLARIGIGRDAVEHLATPNGREPLLSEALRPAAATDVWRQRADDPAFRAHVDQALRTITVIEAANAEEEALAIAIALREAVQQPRTTAALVTPDRALGRRVLAALGRWNIAVEDSGGDALADTPAGVFATLAAEAATGGLAPVMLLALLKHPMLRLGLDDRERAVAALERAILRGPRPNRSSLGLVKALNVFRKVQARLHRTDPRRDLTESELTGAAELIQRIADALAPLEGLGNTSLPLSELAARHRLVLAALSRQDGEEAALAGPDGTKLAAALDDLATNAAAAGLRVEPSGYAELFIAALAGRVVRRAPRVGQRVRILGLLEARLTESDRVVLGGLVEGTWPPDSNNDAWLSRPMRLDLGLDLPERRIGLTAHDFAQLLGAKEVILSHAAKIAGTPTVPSRFVQRLAAIAGKERWKSGVGRGEIYLEWARDLDRPQRVAAATQPAPKPPRGARPKGLSVTEIEHWLRDPYTIYARHVLRLKPLDAINAEPGAAERGTFIHNAIGEFTQKFADALPADSAGELIKLGRRHFAPLEDFPEARAFWWPRFERIAHWFARWEAQRRAAIATVLAETRGDIRIPLDDGEFTLRGVADRIERGADGRYAILDYKTGLAPSEKQVRTGFSPQLTLEAAILRNGGFPGIPAGGTVGEVAYVLLKGGERPGEPKPLKWKEGTSDSQAEIALARLTEVAKKFEQESQAYTSLVHPMWTTRYGDYDHLARVKEWSSSGGDDGGGE